MSTILKAVVQIGDECFATPSFTKITMVTIYCGENSSIKTDGLFLTLQSKISIVVSYMLYAHHLDSPVVVYQVLECRGMYRAPSSGLQAAQ